MIVVDQLGYDGLQPFSMTLEKGLTAVLTVDAQALTKLARYLSGCQAAAQGQITADGPVGYMPAGAPMYTGMTVKEWLVYMAQLKGLDRVQAAQQAQQLMERFDQEDCLIGKKTTSLERRRYVLLQTLLGSPAGILLDQPAEGLLPDERDILYGMLQEIQEEYPVLVLGMDPDSVMAMCHGLYLLQEGRLFEVTQEELATEYAELRSLLTKETLREEEDLRQILEDYEGGSRNDKPSRSK